MHVESQNPEWCGLVTLLEQGVRLDHFSGPFQPEPFLWLHEYDFYQGDGIFPKEHHTCYSNPTERFGLFCLLFYFSVKKALSNGDVIFA